MSQRFKVLVADDEKLIAQNIARKIEQTNSAFQVVAKAGTGLEALELASQLMPDVVFSDIKMPEMDGIELIGKLEQHDSSILTVIVSGYNDFAYARAALQHRAVDYLLKPINPDDLQQALSKLESILLARERQLAPRREESPREVVENVLIYLRENYAQQIDFSAIAEQQAVSAPYLSRIFKEQVGMTPSKFLADYRMQVAKKLLQDTSLSVKEVATRVGFSDQFHFSKTFKQFTGLSPVQFRKD